MTVPATPSSCLIKGLEAESVAEFLKGLAQSSASFDELEWTPRIPIVARAEMDVPATPSRSSLQRVLIPADKTAHVHACASSSPATPSSGSARASVESMKQQSVGQAQLADGAHRTRSPHGQMPARAAAEAIGGRTCSASAG